MYIYHFDIYMQDTYHVDIGFKFISINYLEIC